MEYGKVCLRRGEEKDVRGGSFWIFDNEIDWYDDICPDGGIVDVIDSRMKFVARGYFNSKSKIVVRVLTRDKNEDINEDFFRRKMQAAWNFRQSLGFANSCRVIFGSTTHEAKQTPYHASKRDGGALLAASAVEGVTVLMPNTFGPGGKPFYNSVVSTFRYQAANGETMTVAPGAGEVLLIDVHTLAAELIRLAAGDYPGERVVLKHRFAVPVQQIADLLDDFRKNGKNIRKDEFSELLYETFESYKKQEKWC